MHDTIRALVERHGQIPVPADALAPDRNLYDVGLSSFAAVQLMLALEQRFDVMFPDRMMNRRSFASIDAMARCVVSLLRAAA